ncbi:type 1 glutamine amidotransferase [Pseudooceanicola sp.]|uniref:type 1 glutamine amidotransferase n=1 Tax=Pseudooceanicola sp. TaxID=1914328 RepID=UPI0035C69AC9
MTNTDESDFAKRHPGDGQKFADLIHGVRPDWDVTSYKVTDGIFPEDCRAYDGLMITGSPASVLDTLPWVEQLLDLIRTAHDADVPMFGACFGHQAIAMALGGRVERNPAGWGFGLIDMSVQAEAPGLAGRDRVLQYGAHIDHVTALPKDARVLFSADHCPIAGFAIGDRVYTTQNHPEMTPGFIAALVEEYADKLDPQAVAKARQSLRREADNAVFANSIATFFEAATGV